MKKIFLVALTIVLGLLSIWFFGGLAHWLNENREWFHEMGPWGSFGGFLLTFISLMMSAISLMLGVITLINLIDE